MLSITFGAVGAAAGAASRYASGFASTTLCSTERYLSVLIYSSLHLQQCKSYISCQDSDPLQYTIYIPVYTEAGTSQKLCGSPALRLTVCVC
jgi:hypothetical protein